MIRIIHTIKFARTLVAALSVAFPAAALWLCRFDGSTRGVRSLNTEARLILVDQEHRLFVLDCCHEPCVLLFKIYIVE